MKRAGFTLVEMLIALAIFGMLTAAGVTLLSLTVRAQETADRMNAGSGELRRLGALLSADLAQAAPRPWRDRDGRPRPAFGGGASGRESEDLLSFVRRGRHAGEDAAASPLQRVAYRLAGGRLLRVAFARVDGGEAAVEMPVLADVGAARLRFRDDEGAWRERWDPTDPARLPRAVELVAETERHGALRLLFLVGDGR